MEEVNKQHQIPKWLKSIQENSWELELLISGGAIFTLFQFSDLLLDLVYSLGITSAIPGTRIYMLFGILVIQSLKLGFITHLMLRSFWLALVCINYVFPSGVNKAKIKWKKPFRVIIDQGEDLKSPILKVDRACGTVIFLTIISTMILFGILISVLVLFTIPALIFPSIGSQFFLGILGICILVYFIDLISFGGLRKVKILAILFFPVLKLYDMLTLRFVYQDALWLYNTNIKKWKYFVGITMFGGVSLFFMYITVYRIQSWPNVVDQRAYRWQMAPYEKRFDEGFYRDAIPFDHNRPRYTPNIQSAIISNNFIQLEIPYLKEYDEVISELPEGQRYLSNIVEIRIDDSLYSKIDWYYRWGTTNDDKCIKTNISIMHLSHGKHELELISTKKRGVIPFWKNE